MSGRMAGYPYDGRDLLRQPERYRYSPFQGESFLRTYLEARARAATRFEACYLARLQEVGEAGPAPWVGAYAPWLNRQPGLFSPRARAAHRGLLGQPPGVPSIAELGRAIVALQAADRLSTVPTLSLLLAALVQPDSQEAELAAPWALRFIHRFEIAKRLVACYTPALQPASDAWLDVLSYALLAACAVLLVERDGSLVALNGALKLNDLLGTTELEGHTSVSLFCCVASHRAEVYQVQALARRHGVRL